MDWSKAAVMFPGQGSQVLGMGSDFAERYAIARETFAEADDLLGFGLSRVCWEGPESELNQTRYTQPALFVCSVAIWRTLRELAPSAAPTWMAGHSLGEFTALTAAGALSWEDGLRLVNRRATLMWRAGEDNPGAMAALLGLDAETVEELCAEVSQECGEIVVMANDNCPGQAVVSGATAGVDRILKRAAEAGAKRGVKLAVSIAAHSPLMDSASAAFQEAIDATSFRAPSARVLGNVSAMPLCAGDSIRAELNQQLTHAVRWSESMRAIIADGAEAFIEIGAGTVLTGLLRRIDRKKTRVSINSVDAIEFFLESMA